MEFPQPLESGVLVQRYKRFFADVAMDDGRHITAHCPNTGPMLGLSSPGMRVWLSRSDSVTRKFAYTWELVQQGNALVGSNTLLPNRIAREALEAGAIPELAGYDLIRREVRYGAASRVDFLLEKDGAPPCFVEVKSQRPLLQRDRRCWIEVKSVTLSRTHGLAEFPDCQTSRGAKHLAELEMMVRAGDRAVVLFIVQRSDCDRFSAATDLDPKFNAALEHAVNEGVEVLAYACDVNLMGIEIAKPLPWLRHPRSAQASPSPL